MLRVFHMLAGIRLRASGADFVPDSRRLRLLEIQFSWSINIFYTFCWVSDPSGSLEASRSSGAMAIVRACKSDRVS